MKKIIFFVFVFVSLFTSVSYVSAVNVVGQNCCLVDQKVTYSPATGAYTSNEQNCFLISTTAKCEESYISPLYNRDDAVNHIKKEVTGFSVVKGENYAVCMALDENYSVNATKMAIVGTDGNNISIPYGQKRIIEVVASPVSEAIKSVSCLNCASFGGAVGSVGGAGDKLTLTVDTSKITQAKKNDPILISVKGTNASDKFNIFTVNIKLTSASCDFSASDCINPDRGNPFACFSVNGKCYAKDDESICPDIKEKNKDLCDKNTKKGSLVCIWNEARKQCFTPLSASIQDRYKKPEGYAGSLPDCAFSGDCNNINDLLELIVNFARGMFFIMGGFAFVFFVYGGFTMIVSFGNAEKVKKGQQILVAAVVGLVIAFSGYLLINTMLSALNVKDIFRGIN